MWEFEDDIDHVRLAYHPWDALVTEGMADASPEFVVYDDQAAGEPALSLLGKASRREQRLDHAGDVPSLPAGLYAFGPSASPWCGVMAIRDGARPRDGLIRRAKELRTEHFLIQALELCRRAYRERPKPAAPRYAKGEWVRQNGRDGNLHVMRVLGHEPPYRYEVKGSDGIARRVGEDSLTGCPFDPYDASLWLAGPPGTASDIALTLTLAKLAHPLSDVVYSYGSSRTVFRPYQFRPLLKLLSGDTQRLLIADEVGLGKTIEAGLMWDELEQRTHLRGTKASADSSFRALVVCPAALVPKWRDEMRLRFDRELVELDNDRLDALIEDLRKGRDRPLSGVVSLERLRRARQLPELAELSPRFDLVIVDEAHYLRNRGTRSHALGQRLSDWADALVLLSATPLNLGSEDLYNLVALLDDGEFPDHESFRAQLEPNRVLNKLARRLSESRIENPAELARQLIGVLTLSSGAVVAVRPQFMALFSLLNRDHALEPTEIVQARRHIGALNVLANVINRTRKVDVPDAKAKRVASDVRVEWSNSEREFYDELRRLCMQRAQASGTASGFAAQMWLRQAASCIPAMQRLLRERGILGGQPDALLRDFISDEAAEDMFGPDGEGDSGPEGAREGRSRELQEQHARLAQHPALCKELPHDTKHEAFVGMLRQARDRGLRQAMVFSYFSRTLEYLRDKLADEFRVRVMYGKIPTRDRPEIMRAFRAGEFDILLVSEVGSEGLDFEFCNVLVNYDLPWNPMRVEQRIGRLDRIGQKHEKIFIYNMHVPGTIETDIFQRLYDRIRVFEDSIGELEPILRGQLSEIQRIVLNPKLSDRERNAQLDRIALAQLDHSRDLEDLVEHRAVLTDLDGLLIEGFTDRSPGRGRFLGSSELVRLVRAFLVGIGGGRLEQVPGAAGEYDLIGNAKLSDLVYRAQQMPGTSSWGDLQERIRSGTPVRLLADQGAATESRHPLLSTRHPVVRAASLYFGATDQQAGIPRFGAVRLPGLEAGRRFLVEVSLAETFGIRPRCELWTSAVDLTDMLEAPDVGARLLSALAEDALHEADPASAAPGRLLAAARDRLEDISASAQQREEQLRKTENDQLIEAMRNSRKQGFEVKISRTAELLKTGDLNPGLRTIYGRRVADLEARRDAVDAELTRRGQFSLSSQPVAYVVVSA
ncbi:DEAD/DEAH box helicase [Streptomycetaceae bacterium NBC_01309]